MLSFDIESPQYGLEKCALAEAEVKLVVCKLVAAAKTGGIVMPFTVCIIPFDKMTKCSVAEVAGAVEVNVLLEALLPKCGILLHCPSIKNADVALTSICCFMFRYFCRFLLK